MHTLHRYFMLLLSLSATAVLAGGANSRFVTEWNAWRASRLEELRRPVGWLSLAGLHWLEPGENHLDGISATFVLEGDAVRFSAPASAGWTIDGAPVTSRILRSDASG